MRLVLLTAALMLGCGQSWAATALPIIDVTAGCRHRVGSLGEGSINQCLRLEQKTYDALKARWPDIPEKDRAQMVEYGRRSRMISYQPLQNSMARLDARRARQKQEEEDGKPFTFQY